MKEWIENELYSELLQMPLWTAAAFESLKEGDVLSPEDARYQLIVYLCVKHVNKVPDHIWDIDYHHTWTVKDFVPTIKAAIKQSPKREFSNSWNAK